VTSALTTSSQRVTEVTQLTTSTSTITTPASQTPSPTTCYVMGKSWWCQQFLRENLMATQMVNQFPAFYGTRSFISLFTSTVRWNLSWRSSVQSTTSHLCLDFPCCHLPDGFQIKILIYFTSPTFLLHAHQSHILDPTKNM
jgi:hypothetical protein